ncbi:hypothetical protein SCARR_02335 [Pontiella sulfatireligans]|uniref:Uncharacterized protein n=2 Tax=Pontiella sulfatireligans TaxID=2750658 RepID=A0A6C2ULT8_9BACT|nr:hypothetical protein SCARR_02335 [Pontiella sulfatireligans]
MSFIASALLVSIAAGVFGVASLLFFPFVQSLRVVRKERVPHRSMKA